MRRRFSWLALLLMLGLLLPAATQAQKPSGLEWQVSPLYGEKYHPSVWLPLRVRVTNDTTDRQVDVHVGNYNITLDVPGGSQKETILYVQLGQTTQVPMAIYEKGSKLDTATLRVDPVSSPIIGTLLEKPMPRIAGFEFVALAANDVPSSAMALYALDGLAITEQQWNELSAAQHTAIQNWVAHGGTLITITTATNALPDALKPATSGNPVTISGVGVAAAMGYEQSPPDFAAVALQPQPNSTVILNDGTQPLLVQHLVKDGAVVASAIDLTDQNVLGWRGVNALWERMVQRTLVSPWGGPFETVDSMRDGTAIGYLNNLSSLDLPPLKTLLILLGIYILLAGPVNYLLLRWRDRMAWAWFTIPLLTAIFAVLAYGIGARQRGTDIIINEVAFIDGNGSSTSTIKGYAGVFSPVRQEYRLVAEAQSLLRPLLPNGFTPPGNAQNVIYSQDPSEIPSLTVNQWTLEGFAFERTINDAPTLDYDLMIDGSTLRGTVTNTSKQTFSDAVLVVFGDFQKLGTLKPGEQRSIEIKLGASTNQASLSYMLYQQELDKAYQTPQGPDRDLLGRTQALDMAMPMLYGANSFKPTLIAFTEQQWETISLPDQRFSRSQRTVYMDHPTFRFGDNALTLKNMWFNYTTSSVIAAGGSDFCMTSVGNGVNFVNRTDDIHIRIPAELNGYQPSTMKFTPLLEGSIDSSKLSYELYNWQAATWEPVNIEAGAITVNAPQTYFNNGEVTLRYSLPANLDLSGGFWGCFTPNVTMEGAMQ